MWRKHLKRGTDFLLSLTGLMVLSPLLLLIAILIKLESKGPVIFRQKRLGLHGVPFEIYKFRSMCVGAEKQGSGVYSFKGDSRITRVGRIIRATSIDELPQLVNILKGDMALIGPRPALTITLALQTVYRAPETDVRRAAGRDGLGAGQRPERGPLARADRTQHRVRRPALVRVRCENLLHDDFQGIHDGGQQQCIADKQVAPC